jgi:signal transduction histidine kinase
MCEADMELDAKKLLEMEGFSCQAELTGGLLHEINNSLTAILGFTQLLINSPREKDDENQDLKAIEEEALRSRKMIQSFVHLFQQYPEVEGPLEMNSLLDHLLFHLQNQWQFLHIDLIKEFYPEDLHFRGSLQEWRIVLIGLLLRAVHAAGQKGIVKIITSKKGAGEALQVVIEGSETRVQKDMAVRPLIFLRSPRKKVVDLGTYLAQRAAKQSGGALMVEHPPQGGFTISISLPMVAGR